MVSVSCLINGSRSVPWTSWPVGPVAIVAGACVFKHHKIIALAFCRALRAGLQIQISKKAKERERGRVILDHHRPRGGDQPSAINLDR